MANIKVIVDGNEYSEDQFKSDMIRMFDTYRDSDSTNMGKATCGDVTCYYCPLYLKECNAKRAVSFEIIKCIYDWAKEHPIKTNRDKLKEVFNVNLDKDAELYLSYYAGQRIKFDLTTEDRWVNQPINKWLDSEYKGNTKNLRKEKKNNDD